MKIGIMQGRLSPRLEGKPYQYFPIKTWKQEFEIAAALGFDYIELVYNKETPFDEQYIVELRQLTKKTGVQTLALCFDYLLERETYGSYVGPQEANQIIYPMAIQRLLDILKKGKEIGLQVITLPFLEESSLETQDDVDGLISILEKCTWSAEKNGIYLCLETDLPYSLYKELENSQVAINVTHDTGNFAYYQGEEFNNFYIKYFNNRHVHIKDRLSTGESCLIGKGLVNWKEVLPTLINYNQVNTYTLQGCRSEIYNSLEAEINIVKQQLETTKNMLNEHARVVKEIK